MTTATRDRALAAVLLVAPLLPTGLQHLGLGYRPYVFIPVACLAVLAIASRCTGADVSAEVEERPARVSTLSFRWWAFVAVALASAIVGLTAANPLTSGLFWSYLPVEISRLLSAPAAVDNPLYPARTWITFLTGALSFAMVRSICLRSDAPGETARIALFGWAGGFSLVSGLAILQYVTRFNLHAYWLRVNPNLVRSHSTLEDPNALGSYLVLGIGVAAGLLLADEGKSLRRTACFAAVTLGVLALATTVSRAAWGGFAIVLVVAFGFAPKGGATLGTLGGPKLRRLARTVLIVMLAVVLVSLLARTVIPSTQTEFRPRNPIDNIVATLDPRIPLSSVMQQRHLWWSTALLMFADQPLVGVGLGRYGSLVGEYSPVANLTVENAHGLPFQLLAEMGAIGFWLFAAFVTALLRMLWDSSKSRDPATAAIAFGVLIGSASLLLTLLSGNALLLSSIQFLWGTALGATSVALAAPDQMSTEVAQT